MASLTNIAKAASAALANIARNSASLANYARSGGTYSTPGLYYGFGAFTYANSTTLLVAGSTTALINQAKS